MQQMLKSIIHIEQNEPNCGQELLFPIQTKNTYYTFLLVYAYLHTQYVYTVIIEISD